MELFSALLQPISLIVALFGIGFLIGFHELGHFLFCKLFGIKTPSFSIGFGPKIIAKKIGDTEFILSAIPLGGFVEIAGAAEVGQGEQKEAYSTAADSFAIRPYYQKFLVMTGGIMCNLLFAYASFIFLSIIGLPESPLLQHLNSTTQITSIEPDSPAARAFLKEGDLIVALNNTPVENNTPLLVQTVQELPDQLVPLIVMRDGERHELMITLGTKTVGNATIGVLGVTGFKMKELPAQSIFGSIKQGIALTNGWIMQTIRGFGSIFSKRNLKGVGGPIVIISMLTKGATASFKIFLILLAIISINLAILNLIPVPILDGGQLLFYTIEAIIGRPLPLKVREYIHIACWLLFLALILYLTVFDIAHIASPLIEKIKQLVR